MDGREIRHHYRETHARIGLVAQEMAIEMFETVWDTASFSRSLFGFILGLGADSFEKLQIVPIRVITPLTFLGGTFYSMTALRRAT